MLGASATGDHLYYQDAGGLKLWHAGETSTVAPGPEAADPANFDPASGTARVSADGTRLAFLSRASLTGYDNRQAPAAGTSCDQSAPLEAGRPCSEVFLYQAPADRLLCVSCRPSGARPAGPSSVPAAIENGSTLAHKPRALAAAGQRLYFDSTDTVLPSDFGARPDVYQWEAQGQGDCAAPGGCLALISRGPNSDGSSFLDASASGEDVFFLTADSLAGGDTGFTDVYDARVGGGFPAPSKPIECAGDSCQPLPSAPEDPTPATLLPSPGNPPLRFAGQRRRCKRGAVRKGGRCLRRRARCRRGSAKQRRRCRQKRRRAQRGARRGGRR